ncbi:MAG TPA: OmpA family protein [Bacteroidales bacterium]|nr:OmpA family protein [Bacteroidales bacterium]
MKTKSVLIGLILIISTSTSAQIGRTYSDGHGGRIFFPFGDISFADELVSFNKGNPFQAEEYSNPQKALNIPDNDGSGDKNSTGLGHGGELIVKFTDNTLYDIDGYDLYVFEIGSGLEPVDVYISKNGVEWISVGQTGGGFSKIDISEYVKKTDVFRYVKIVDVKDDASGEWPGAEIDAVGAIGSSMNFQLNSSVLFKSGESTIGEDKSSLYKIGEKIKNLGGLTIIEGYTDNVGSSESNLHLSEARAITIKSFFIDSCQIDANLLEINAYGEINPIADNNTEVGRMKNRRVEIIVFPKLNLNKNDVVGIWNTDWGELHIYRYGNIIAGWYTEDYGEILGELSDEHTIIGKWVENDSGESCAESIYGRNHWGRMIMKFNDDFTELTTKWGYCTIEPTKEDWNGERK